MPNFTADWFSGNIAQWTGIFRGVKWNPLTPKTVVEIGCYEGRATLWILKNLLQHADSRIHCIDTFTGGNDKSPYQTRGLFERFTDNIRESGDEAKVIVHQDLSWRPLVKLIGAGTQADFVYVDGSHLAPDVLEDAVLSYRLLRVGGVMICDDYLWSMEKPGQDDILNSPKLAIDAFTNLYRRKMAILAYQKLYQLVLRKIAA